MTETNPYLIPKNITIGVEEENDDENDSIGFALILEQEEVVLGDKVKSSASSLQLSNSVNRREKTSMSRIENTKSIPWPVVMICLHYQ